MTYRIFLSAASAELASYREEVARVLRRKGIEVCEQQHFRLGGTTLLEKLNKYIAECDAIICLIGVQCGSRPTVEHTNVMYECEWTTRFREASGLEAISYTQWEFLLAKSLEINTYVFFTDKTFEPDNVSEERAEEQALQMSYRAWIKSIGQDRTKLTSYSQLVEDVLVLPFPDLSSGQPNNLPLSSLGSLFKGREQFLKVLHQQLNKSAQGTTAITEKANPQRAQAVHGYGGIGKTRTAIEYAWRHANDYSALLFLSAESSEALSSNLAGLADVLYSTALAGVADEQRIREALAWLQKNTGWLLILDNVDTDEAAEAIKILLPKLMHGNVLITSRLAQFGATIETLDLGVLELGDATSYLLEATEDNRTRSIEDDKRAKDVAVKTGQLALGLEHAAAWINASYLGFEDYLSQWDRDETEILLEFDQNQISYPRELLVTWKLSVDRLNDEARQLLDVLSWLSPELVPDTFFQAVPDDCHKTPRKSIATLIKYSLARRVQQDKQCGFQVHRLVQISTRYHQLQTSSGKLPALDRALAWIDNAFQGSASDVRDWPTLEPLAEHVDTVCKFGLKHHKTDRGQPTSRLLNNLAQLYDEKARYEAAELLMRRVLQIEEHNFGENHPRVATPLSNLASLLHSTNCLTEAESLMRRALQIDEHNFGEDHPKVALRLCNLALLLNATNHLSEAEPLMRRALRIDEKNYGEDHPTVAIHLNNLAALLQDTNRLSEAELMMRQALQIDEHSFGEDHPNVARDLGNLALLLTETNRVTEAEPLMRRALQIDEHNFGENHPNVARHLGNLALLLTKTNRETEAEPLIRRALQIDERNFGEDHPAVAIHLSNLARLLQVTNRLSEAEPLMRRALQIDEHSFGEKHPVVALDLCNLARLLQERNVLSEAKPLMGRGVEILHDFGKATGHVHPKMEIAIKNYKSLLTETGLSPEDALSCVQEIVA